MKKEKVRFKKPNIIIYYLFRFISFLITKLKFNLKIGKNDVKKQKGPYIILGNHESFIDFINLAMVTRRRISFVISNSFYNSLKVNPLLKACGVIPKQQFQTTVTDIKKMKLVLDHNRPLAIYPAGIMTENGLTTPIPKATAKFIKWMGVDVYVAYTTGSYLTCPKWGKGIRKGKITLDVTKVLSKEEIEKMEISEIDSVVMEQLDFDSYKNQKTQMVEFKKGNNIEGLENVLYWCPKCNSEFTNRNVSIDTMKCEKCGNEVYCDNYGFLHKKDDDSVCYEHVSDWYLELYNRLKYEIYKNPEFSIMENVKIDMLNYKKHQFEEVGNAQLTLNKDKFIINGIINSEEKFIEVPIKKIPTLPFKPGKRLEIQDGNTIYRCNFENGQSVSKWINLIKIFYELNNEKDSY